MGMENIESTSTTTTNNNNYNSCDFSTKKLTQKNNTTVEKNDIIVVPVKIDECNVIDGAREILKVIRPSWSCDNIKFKVSVFFS